MKTSGRSGTERRPPPTSRCVQITPVMRAQYRCVHLYALSACAHTPHDRTRPCARAPPGDTHPRIPLYPHVVHLRHLFLPSLSRSSPPPWRNKNWDPDPLNVIFVTSSSDSSPSPPPRRSACKNKIHITQFMAHVLVPSLPPSCAQARLHASQATASHAQSPVVRQGVQETIPA